MALISGMAVAPINPGTIRKPPPMPKKPESAPTAKPIPISNGNSRRMVSALSVTFGSPPDLRGRSIVSPTTTISAPNSISRREPSTILPSCAPPAAPTMPDSANTSAQDHLTVRARAWPARLAAALAATAMALVPIATCADGTPTT